MREKAFLVLVVLIPAIMGASATLTWDTITDSSVNAVTVYRGTDPECSGTTPLATVIAALGLTNTFVDNLVPDTWTRVCYELTDSNSGGTSGRSNRASKTFPLPPTPAPAPPTSLKVSKWTGSTWQLLASV